MASTGTRTTVLVLAMAVGTMLLAGPAAAAAPATAPAPAFATSGAVTAGTSHNWAGYAQTAPAGSFTAVEGSWTVPAVTATPSGVAETLDWIGIDGFGTKNVLVQAGTESDDNNGVAYYSAWTEILPARYVRLSLAVSPGDRVDVVVQETATNVWSMKVTDLTTGMSGDRTVAYRALGRSVEAIQERPCVGGAGCSFSTLSQTSAVTFTGLGDSTAAAGQPATFAPLLSAAPGARLHSIKMVPGSSVPPVRPSVPGTGNEAFTVA
ncbi:MAG: G1 family glutamic endopeptidase [Acidimicrobiales bacterium]